MPRNRPAAGAEDAVAIGRELYGLDATATELPSDSDRNFLLRDAHGGRFVLKVYRTGADPGHVALETRALERAVEAGLPCPPVIPARSGAADERWLGADGAAHAVRLVGFLEGVHLARVRQTPALLENLGAILGRLDRVLLDLDDPAAVRIFDWDLRRAPEVAASHLEEIADPERRAHVSTLLEDFERRSEGKRAGLRRSVLHADANDYNVLVAPAPGADGWQRFEPTRVSALLDFGDLVHTWTVNEIAIAGAYAMLDRPDPLAALGALVAGYHRELPLTEDELALVFLLARLRLCLSVAMSAHQRALEPDLEYLSISEKPAWRALESLESVHPHRAEWAVRAACGLEPVAGSGRLRRRLADLQPAPILGAPLDADSVAVLDLGVASPILARLTDEHDQHQWSRVVFGDLERTGKTVGWGRFDEARPWYAADQFQPRDGSEPRTVHLGVDLFAAPGTTLYAPLAGRVHSVADNARPLDYGPTLVLEHRLPAIGEDPPVTFHTLYGHLAKGTLDRHRPGDLVERGQPIAELGSIEVNGGWAPHAHVQIVLDLLENVGDFPGVAAPSERAAWLGNSPDPNLLLRLDEELLATSTPTGDDLAVRRRQVLAPSLSLSYRRPLEILRGRGAYLVDADGRRFLDLVNNVCHVGHCHPRVVAAAAEQMALLNTNTRYLHPTVVRYAERLLATFPAPLEICFFVNSGSEANDLALRLARASTGHHEVICLEGAYHGHLTSLIEVSPYKHDGPGGAGTPAHVHKVAMPDTYRGRHRGVDAAARYADEVAAAAERSRQAPARGLAAFLCESILSCGGQVVLPPGYLERCYGAVRAAGGVCIADEVQVGFGRVGSHGWAFETQGVVPDIVTLGKPIGNGHPLAAVVTTRAIADAFANGMEYFNTYGGNPVSAAVGTAVLDVLEEEDLRDRAAALGARFRSGLAELARECPAIGDVRGLGLFLGFELVRDPVTREPDAELAAWLVERMRDRGFLLSTDGPAHDVIKIKPPMVIDEHHVDATVAELGRLLESARLRGCRASGDDEVSA